MKLFKKKLTQFDPADNTQPAPVVQVANSPTSNLQAKLFGSKKRRIITIGGLLILCGLLIYAWLHYQKPTTQTKVTNRSNVCSKEVLDEAAPLLNLSKPTELETLSKKIQGTKNYDKDPNCLYIVTSYYIGLSDYTNAKANLEKLEAVYDPNVGFAPALGKYARNIDSFRDNVDFLKKAEESFKRNTRLAPPEDKP